MTSAAAKPPKHKPAKPDLTTGTAAPQPDALAIRQTLGLSQQEFSTLLGISMVTVSRWENARTIKTGMYLAVLQLLARALTKWPPEQVVATLQLVSNTDHLGRIITLVHMGD